MQTTTHNTTTPPDAQKLIHTSASQGFKRADLPALVKAFRIIRREKLEGVR